MHIDLKPFSTHSLYRRNGIDCYICQARKKLIQQTPEEKVRQAVITYLIKELKTPSDRISAEVPMSYYVKGSSGRADIIVVDDQDKPILLIECKEENQTLSDEAIKQAKKYNKIVQANAIMVTNGILYYFALYDIPSQTYQELSKIPDYNNLTKRKRFTFLKSNKLFYPRPVFRHPIPPLQIKNYIEDGWIGVDTSPLFYPFIFNLIGWMFDWEEKVDPSAFKLTNVLEDAGIRISQFGNAGGGQFGGEYRYFILKDSSNNNQIISLSIFSSMATKYDPHWGNRTGATYLSVAIDDFEISHMSLELNLNRYLEINNDKATIWHNGTLTVGKLGQAPRAEVINFISSEAPQLIDEKGRILLGTFSLNKTIKSTQEETINFLDRLLLYSLVRDKYRKIIKLRV